MRRLRGMVIGLVGVCLTGAWLARAADDSGTTVARWKDDRKAAFLLFFDDNIPSHIKNAIPELQKRHLVGTFYVCPGKKQFWTAFWTRQFPASGMVMGNHTMNHAFVADAAALEKEIEACSAAIAQVYPDRKAPHLLSFGLPGTNPPLKIPDAEVREVLARHNLVYRPAIVMAAIHLKTGKDMTGAVDKAIRTGAVGNVLFHGVGGDYLAASMPDFLQLLDYLVAKQDEVWVTDHVSAHQYETEQKTAEVKLVKKGEKQIQLTLASQADPKLYDQPLTLTTQVPAAWKKCRVTQGGRTATVEVANGTARYDAVPGPDPIALDAAN